MIDAHMHLWSVARGDHGGLTPAAGPLYRDFGWSDYPAAAEGIDGAVLVQAAPTLAETRWLLDVARRTPQVLGVVGWIDFADPLPSPSLDGLVVQGLVGVRPMLQDLPDPAWLLDRAFAAVLDRLAERGLVFDALVRAHQLPMLVTIARRHPGLTIVLDHLGKPDIAGRAWQPWADDVAALAAHANVVGKLSGLLTEAAAGDGRSEVEPYVQHAVAAFGPDRILWGSDWPVVTPRASLADWRAMTAALLAAHGSGAADAILDGNARRIYRLARGGGARWDG